MFDERALVEQLGEFLASDKVVLLAIRLARARGTSGVCHSGGTVPQMWKRNAKVLTGDAEPKFVRIVGEQTLEKSTLAYTRGSRNHKGTE